MSYRATVTIYEVDQKSKDPSTPLASINLAINFLLELYALALFAYWGTVTHDGVWAVVLGIAAPAAMIGIWGRFAAPRSARRLRTTLRIPLDSDYSR